MHWFLLLVAITCEALGTAALKLTEGFTRPLPVAGVLLAYLVSFFCFSVAIKTISIGIAYALWSGLGMILVVIAGWLYFGQKMDLAAAAGLFFIVLGILIIHLYSKSVTF